MTVAGAPHVLHIVGRGIEPADGGRVISTGLDTLREGDTALRPDFYHLVLKRGADPAAVRGLPRPRRPRALEVREIPNPAGGFAAVRAVIAGLIAVLVLIGLAELSTTVGAAVRDRGRDLLALKAVGLTPRQIIAVIVSATVFVALAAASVGSLLGVFASEWLIDLQGRSSGWGSGIAQRPSLSVLLLVGGVRWWSRRRLRAAGGPSRPGQARRRARGRAVAGFRPRGGAGRVRVIGSGAGPARPRRGR